MSERIETRVKDGVTRRVGGQAEVGWITEDTERGRRITAAIPPVFEAYATLTNHPGAPDLPRDVSLERRQDLALAPSLLSLRSTRPPAAIGAIGASPRRSPVDGRARTNAIGRRPPRSRQGGRMTYGLRLRHPRLRAHGQLSSVRRGFQHD